MVDTTYYWISYSQIFSACMILLTDVLTMISVYCFPKNVKGVVKVSGSEELSSLRGPVKSSASPPNWNNSMPLLNSDDTVDLKEKRWKLIKTNWCYLMSLFFENCIFRITSWEKPGHLINSQTINIYNCYCIIVL